MSHLYTYIYDGTLWLNVMWSFDKDGLILIDSLHARVLCCCYYGVSGSSSGRAHCLRQGHARCHQLSSTHLRWRYMCRRAAVVRGLPVSCFAGVYTAWLCWLIGPFGVSEFPLFVLVTPFFRACGAVCESRVVKQTGFIQ